MNIKKRLTNENVFALIMDVIAQVVFCVPWIKLDGTWYSSITYLVHVALCGGDKVVLTRDIASLPLMDAGMDWYTAQPYAIMLVIEAGFLVLCQLLALIHMLLILKKGAVYQTLLTISEVLGFASIYAYVQGPIMASDNYYTEGYIFAPLFIMGIAILGVAMIGSYAADLEAYQQSKAADEAFREEKKQRLRFEGRYSSMFFGVIWKNFMHNWKLYRIFVFVTTVSVSLIFAGFGLWESLKGLHAHDNFTSGQGLSVILFGFIQTMLVLALFLLIMVLLFYLKNHVKNYGMFVTLGMRRRTLYIFMGIELASCVLISIILGLALGNLMVFAARFVIARSSSIAISSGIALGVPTYVSYLLTILASLLISFLSVLLTREVYIDTGASISGRKAIEREKLPGRLSKYAILPGAIVMLISLILFSRLDSFEQTYIIVAFFIGLYLVMRGGLVIFLDNRKKRDSSYYGKLLRYNHFYYRYSSTLRYIFFFAVIHFCVLFVFGKGFISASIATSPAEQYPYDYVCMATTDDGTEPASGISDSQIFTEIRDKYGADISIYPMVRVSNPDNTTTRDNMMANVIPQGQMVGISETTYRELCEKRGVEAETLKKLDAEGKRVAVILQQDQAVSAHPIDYSTYLKPMLHVGQPVQYCDYMKKDEVYPPRNVKYLRQSLIGSLRQGEHENIVVFSDEYFEANYDVWKTTDMHTGEPVEAGAGVEGENIHHFPDQLVLISLSEEKSSTNVAKINKLLEIFNDNHAFDRQLDSSVLSCYSRAELVQERSAELIMNKVLNGFIILVLMMVTLLLIKLKMAAEMQETKRRYEFLECMGVSRKNRKKQLRQEYDDFLILPIAAATVITAVFTLIMWKLRLYSLEDCINYSKNMAVIYLIYVAIEAAGIKLLELQTFRRLEK